MKELLRLVLCIGFVLFEVGSSHAQGTSPGVGPRRKFQHKAEIVTAYDKTKDQTAVFMDWYRVYAGLVDPNHLDRVEHVLDAEDNRVEIQAAFVYPGRVLLSAVDAVVFGIKAGNSGGPLFKARETPELTAVVDGETISLGKALLVRVDTRVTAEYTRQVSFAQLSVRFTYPGLLRIVRAKKVVMKIGPLQFMLRESNLEALRDLASRMVPNQD